MATQKEIDAAAVARILRSADGQVMLAWMHRAAGMTGTPQSPEATDAFLRHMSGRQWLVGTLVQLAKEAE